MNAGKAVYGILSANSGVTDIVGTRIFPEIAEQEAVTPFIVYQLLSVDPEDTHDGPSKLDEVRFEFLCYADSYNAAADLGVAVRAALDRVSGTYNGVHVESVQFNDVDVEIEYDPRRYSQVLKFTFRIKRDDVTIALGTPVTGAVLGDLSDVDVTGVTNGQLIAYNSTSGNWEAADDAGGPSTLSELDDVSDLAPSGSQVLTWSSASNEWQPAALPSPPPTVSDIGDLDDVASVRGTSGQILAVNSAGTELEYIDPSDGFISLDYARLRMGSDVLQGGGSAQDFKSQTAQKAQFNTQEDLQGDGITIDTTNNRFTVTTAGHYRLTVNGTFDSTADRSNPTFYFRVNNTTDLLGEGMGYVRSVNDAEGTANVTRVIELEANDYVEVFGRNSANTSGVSLFATQAIFEIERVGAGAAGPTGATGQGVPTGGTANQALVKIDGTDYNTEWAAIYTQRYESEAETLLDGATETVELYYTAQADGDGLHEDAQTDTAQSGYDIRRKLYYAEKAQADPNTSGDWTQFADIADDTTYASAKATLLAYLKARTGGTVPISLKMTWEEVAEATLLLDTYTGAAAAYSLRQLRTAYTGDAIRVRRASDNTEQNIGFSSGELDTTSLASFCSGTDGFVKTWYDQSGNANDATQSTTANQPKIYDSSTGVVTENGKPAIYFDGFVQLSAGNFSSLTEGNAFFVAKSTTETPATDQQGSPHFFGTASQQNHYPYSNGVIYDSFGSTSRKAFNPTTTLTNLHLSNYLSTSSEWTVRMNGTQETTTASNTVAFNSSARFGNISVYGMDHYLSEYVLYDSDQSSNRTNIEDNINTFYSIY